MLPDIQNKFDSLQKKRNDLVHQLESLPSQELTFKAGSDKWSVVEAIEHLLIVEDNFIKQVSANRPTSSLDGESRSPKKYQTVLKVMQGDIEVDVPHESMEPHGRFSMDELLTSWDDYREKIRHLLAEFNAEHQEDLVYQHPYAGPLNIAETLDFVEVHFDNHVRHIDEILARTKK
jgi:hypothetical protein